MRSLISHASNWYAKYERPISSASLIGGFVFDAIVLKRVDLFWENVWTVGHLVVVAICILLINLQEDEDLKHYDPSHAHFWYINILQFFFGGILSTYLVFYFRSATLSAAWPFLLLLAIAFWANESLKKHYARLTFQISLFFLSLLAFSVYIVPVLSHQIGPDVFMVGGLASLLVLWLFLRILQRFAKKRFEASKQSLVVSVIAIFCITNLLYFFNLIPPIPLSLKEAGIYHEISVNGPGNYTMSYEDVSWFERFFIRETFHAIPGETAHAYSAIFSPSSFKTNIVHEWQKYDETKNTWLTMSRVNLPVIGGREEGYRTYSLMQNITPGVWRVNVETSEGQVIGRMGFDVETAKTPVELKSITKN